MWSLEAKRGNFNFVNPQGLRREGIEKSNVRQCQRARSLYPMLKWIRATSLVVAGPSWKLCQKQKKIKEKINEGEERERRWGSFEKSRVESHALPLLLIDS